MKEGWPVLLKVLMDADRLRKRFKPLQLLYACPENLMVFGAFYETG
jgi:hypothetical protein